VARITKRKELKAEKVEQKELKLEKIEKPERKELKREKIEKPERKELKREKIEKPERKEIKLEKVEKPEQKELKIEGKELKEKDFKDHKPEIEKGFGLERPDVIRDIREIGPAEGGSSVEERLASLEGAVEELTHFIAGELRPDLGQGALSEEYDVFGDPQ